MRNITQTEIYNETERLANTLCPKHSVETTDWKCPYCGSARVACNKSRPTATGMMKHQMHCYKCGKYYSISDSTYRRYKNERD